MKQATLVSGGMRGTLPWMAPELLTMSGTKVSEKVLLWLFYKVKALTARNSPKFKLTIAKLQTEIIVCIAWFVLGHYFSNCYPLFFGGLAQIDVYSFGIAMWEILTGEDPYDGMHYGGVIGMLILRSNFPPELGHHAFCFWQHPIYEYRDLLDAKFKLWNFEANWCPTGHSHSIQWAIDFTQLETFWKLAYASCCLIS